MTIKQFIEKAIEGGWEGLGTIEDFNNTLKGYDFEEVININDYILDPLAWQAVGKVDGWGKDSHEHLRMRIDEYEFHMLRMVHYLCKGGSIEEFLKSFQYE